jgi:hypothetical protein
MREPGRPTRLLLPQHCLSYSVHAPFIVCASSLFCREWHHSLSTDRASSCCCTTLSISAFILKSCIFVFLLPLVHRKSASRPHPSQQPQHTAARQHHGVHSRSTSAKQRLQCKRVAGISQAAAVPRFRAVCWWLRVRARRGAPMAQARHAILRKDPEVSNVPRDCLGEPHGRSAGELQQTNDSKALMACVLPSSCMPASCYARHLRQPTGCWLCNMMNLLLLNFFCRANDKLPYCAPQQHPLLTQAKRPHP